MRLTPSCVYHHQVVSLGIDLTGNFHEMISQPSSPSISLSQKELRVFLLHHFFLAPASSFPLPESPDVSLHTQAVTWFLQFVFCSTVTHLQTGSCEVSLVMGKVLPYLHQLEPSVSPAPL